MKILQLYLFKCFIHGFLISLAVLLSIEIFFSFTAEIKYLNDGNYSFFKLIQYILLNIPRSINIMFPYAVLIGAMLSLGAMASDLEFVSMQAAGISVSKIMFIILSQVFVLSIVFYLMSDFIVPKYTTKAEQKKNFAINKKIIFQRNGVWFKDDNAFIKIREIYSESNLKEIIIYNYNEENKLQYISYIKEADLINGKWILKGVNKTFFSTNPISKEYHKVQIKDEFINQQLINIKTQNSLSLSLSDVRKNIKYLDNNNLDTTVQTKIFWEKLFQPVSTVIMLFLAMPFIFGRYRQNNLSKRIVIGVLIGISFFIVSSILPNIGIVLGIYPFFNILLTNIMFVVIGYYLYEHHLETGLR